ncbi:2,3-butanediol dehydrogenase [Natrinema caseinilyticum]|uniref:2,3-butanediol dehydrogenase n=1 Tax=Natrinema caseinilyticum TaxID=2961570 RepID=UPI0020C381D1|nr:2,3-butanediol dehydrogenase [Natrinema caseinilyticum]
MRAAVYHGREDLRVEEIDEQPLEPTAVRVRVDACGICGSDLHEYAQGPIAIPSDEPHPGTGESLPLPLGHEVTGHVTETGRDVESLAEGDPVVVNPIIGCGDCPMCIAGRYYLCDSLVNVGIHGHGGGFADNLVVPAENAVRLPKGFLTEYGALVEPLSVALHAVRRSDLEVGDTVSIFGAGPIGLGVLQVAIAAGAKRVYISEPRTERRELAARLGATEVIDPADTDPVRRISAATDGGTDVAFEVAGVEATVTEAIRSTRKTGDVVVVSVYEEAVSLNLNYVMMAERTVTGSYGYRGGARSRTGEFETAIELLDDGRIEAEPMVTGRIELEEIVPKGFERLLKPDSEHVKILVEP